MAASRGAGLTPADLFALQSVGEVEISPSGTHVAYAVVHNTERGRPHAVVTILNLQTGAQHTLPRGSSIRSGRPTAGGSPISAAGPRAAG